VANVNFNAFYLPPGGEQIIFVRAGKGAGDGPYSQF
jgi:hypothetical protein